MTSNESTGGRTEGQARRMSLGFVPLSPRAAELGESPVWSQMEGCVWWVDIPGRTLFRTRARDGATEAWDAPEQVGFAALADGGVVAGLETGLFGFDPGTGRFDRLVTIPGDEIRFNDAATDSAGRIWATTMDMKNRRPVGELLRIDPDLTVSSIQTGLRTPNGVAFDAKLRRLYLSDSHPDIRTIWAFDVEIETGRVGERRVFAQTWGLEGRPDGAAIDESGNYWVAGVGGGAIYVFAPDGSMLHEIPTPMKDPTKIAFGGSDLTSLYLTSKEGPGGGGVLAVAAIAFKGRPSAKFAGAGAATGEEK